MTYFGPALKMFARPGPGRFMVPAGPKLTTAGFISNHLLVSRSSALSVNSTNLLQGAKNYLKHGRSVDQYVNSKLSFDYDKAYPLPVEPPVPNPRPSLKNRTQPVAITAMYENVIIKEQNPRRKLRRNAGPGFETNEGRPRNQGWSLESLLDDSMSPSDCERYGEGPRVDIPLSPSHYNAPPTPDHPPPSAKQAENSIHERIRPLSQVSEDL